MLERQVFCVENNNFASFNIVVTFNGSSETNITRHKESFDAIVEDDFVAVIIQQLINADFMVFFCILEEWNHVAKM